ncbi:MAG: hypothetical protein VKQ33_00405 [Candidatus Sericytochromatia bacterium]|nr:hypothetical protein [Candidatus Sericytochromatia bacterium]
MNAELQRNLWLELRPLPVAASLGVLALLAFAATVRVGPLSAIGLERLQGLGLFVFCFHAIWGLRKASAAVSAEVLGGTWDQQRLSGQSGASLLAGKLLGATAFTWVGALGGLTLYTPAQLALGDAPLALLHAATLVLGALAAQAAALAGSLLTAGRLRRTRRGGPGALSMAGWLLGLWLGLMLLTALAGSLGLHEVRWRQQAVAWWLPLPLEAFIPFSMALWGGWLLLGLHRLLRLELQQPVTPWAWLAFLAFVPAYAAPLLPTWQAGALGWLQLATATVLGATWVTLLLERVDAVRLRTLVGLWQRDERPGLWGALPLWMLTLPLALAGAAILLALALLAWGLPPLADLGRGGMAFSSAALFLVRDAALVLSAQLATPRHREPLGAILVGGLLLYALLPGTLVALGGPAQALLPAFWPHLAWDVPGSPSLGAFTIHVGLAVPGTLLAVGLATSVARRATSEALTAAGR